MKEKLKNNETQQLFEAFLKLRTVDECANLFDDLCTANEIRSLAQRLAVAKLLRRGMSYVDIVKQTGASTATISRVNRCLQYGSDGYNTVLDRTEA